MGASLTQSHAHFSSGSGFMVCFGKPKLCTKFESLASAIVQIQKWNFERKFYVEGDVGPQPLLVSEN